MFEVKKAFLSFLAVITVLLSCGAAIAAEEIVIGISMDAIDSQFWLANQASMKKTLDGMGVKYTEVIADGDTQKQNQQVETLISMGVKAIIIAPKDGTAIVSAIKKCNEAGIPVVMNNRAAGLGAVVGCNVASDNKEMVLREFDYIAEKAKAAGKKYKLMEFIGNLTDVNAVYRHEGVQESVKKYPDIFTEVIEIPTEWKAENVDSLGQAALQANPDVNMIFCASDSQILPMKSFLMRADRWFPASDPKHITIATFDGAADAVNEIKQGYIDCVSVQDATMQGELCAKNAVALAKGEPVEANVFDPGFEVTIENWEKLGFAGY
jgi:ABC-type sugar transport system substrate-binding protein